jgi:AcrR family transcriptional regulator
LPTVTPEHDGRRARSRRTRTRLVDAATALFVERGYVATTVEAVAAAAGVAVPTVYYVFGTKPHLLAAVLDASIAGTPDTPAVVDQPWVEALAVAEDAGEAVATLVARSVGIIARAAAVYEVVRRASADPEVGALLDGNRQARREDQRHLVEVLAAAGHLRPGLDVDAAADAVYALVNEEVYGLLVDDCGWDVARFEAWLADHVRHQLVAR